MVGVGRNAFDELLELGFFLLEQFVEFLGDFFDVEAFADASQYVDLSQLLFLVERDGQAVEL